MQKLHISHRDNRLRWYHPLARARYSKWDLKWSANLTNISFISWQNFPKKWTTQTKNYIKKLVFNWFCPQKVKSWWHLLNRISTNTYSPLTYIHPVWIFSCKGNVSGQWETIDGKVSEETYSSEKMSWRRKTSQDRKRLP